MSTDVPDLRLRLNYLSPQQVRLLDDWGKAVRQMFPQSWGVYQVGSSLMRAGWRDVDVRIIMRDEAYEQLAKVIKPRRLSLPLSMWGHQVTGLPIDCQVQPQFFANAEYGQDTHRRNPIGVRDSEGVEGA